MPSGPRDDETSVIVDTGPLVALLDAGDNRHGDCIKAIKTLTGPLMTTWPVLSEAMFLTARAGGWPMQRALWSLVLRDDLVLFDLDRDARERSSILMERYRDVPMALADATLVALAEQLKVSRVFTLDSDFRIYRYRGRGHLTVVP